jgi:hypothetical protein
MSKGLNTDSMSRLLGGLTGSKSDEETESPKDKQESPRQEATTDAAKEKKPSKAGAEERFCTIVDVEQIEKIRMIAAKEDVTIKDLVSLAFDVIIKKYESLHGKIKVNKHKKGNLRDVFEL